MAGPLGPGLGQVPSAQTPSWQFAASSTARALAPLWSATASVLAGDARLVIDGNGSRRLYVYPSATTTGSAAPTFNGTGTDGSQSNVLGYAMGGGASNGINVENTSGSLVVWGGDNLAALNASLMPNGGARGLPIVDPSRYFVTAPSGSPVVSVEAYL
jgi:hypothetical protein